MGAAGARDGQPRFCFAAELLAPGALETCWNRSQVMSILFHDAVAYHSSPQSALPDGFILAETGALAAPCLCQLRPGARGADPPRADNSWPCLGGHDRPLSPRSPVRQFGPLLGSLTMPLPEEVPTHPHVVPSRARTGAHEPERPQRTGQTRFWLVIMGVCSAGFLALEALRRML